MTSIISEIDAKIAVYKESVILMGKMGMISEVERYSGIIEGLKMAEEIIKEHGDDGK
jgi:hypothetical protein